MDFVLVFIKILKQNREFFKNFFVSFEKILEIQFSILEGDDQPGEKMIVHGPLHHFGIGEGIEKLFLAVEFYFDFFWIE